MSSNDKPGAFAPFKYPAFALLWTATLISNIGTWMHDVGAGWLMTTLNPSPAVVTLVQTATTLPVFLFALFAGALADRLDKRRMLIAINVALLLVVSTLAFLVWQGRMTPLLLIGFTLAVGTGVAFMAPAWQAIVPQLVPRDTLKPAVALNSMGINISRAIGPALAGVLIAGIGLASPFMLNAASYVVIIGALLLWRSEPVPMRVHRSSIAADMGAGLRHVRHNPAMLATLIRAVAFFLFASAYWSLLPLVARGIQGGGAELYGILMALIGFGAVTGALLLPRLHGMLTTDQTVRIGTIGTAAALVLLSLSDIPSGMMAAAFFGGFSWIAVLTSLNVSAQTALPDWVRARGLAVFLMVFFGSMALGSVFWGQIASYTTVPTALIIAAGGLVVGLIITRRFPVGQAEAMDLSAATSWPAAPALEPETPEHRAAMVTVEYRIAESDRAAFLNALHEFSKERLRNGATQWYVHHSVEDPAVWIETFFLPSWAEHLEQHSRLTRFDADLQAKLRDFVNRERGPLVRHYIAPF